MFVAEPTKQLAFRLPESLIERIEECLSRTRGTGLNLTRADIVRLLLTHALDDTGCDPRRLIFPNTNGRKKP